MMNMKITGSSDPPIAPKTILTLKRDPICPERRSANSRHTLLTRISVNTISASTMNTESANQMANAFPCSGCTGTLSDPSVITAARSSATITPPIASLHCCCRSFTALPLGVASACFHTTRRWLQPNSAFSMRFGDNLPLKGHNIGPQTVSQGDCCAIATLLWLGCTTGDGGAINHLYAQRLTGDPALCALPLQPPKFAHQCDQRLNSLQRNRVVKR